MYKIIITLAVWCLILYYAACFAQIFGLIKFTAKSIKIKKLFIPFYYLLKN